MCVIVYSLAAGDAETDEHPPRNIRRITRRMMQFFPIVPFFFFNSTKNQINREFQENVDCKLNILPLYIYSLELYFRWVINEREHEVTKEWRERERETEGNVKVVLVFKTEGREDRVV